MIGLDYTYCIVGDEVAPTTGTQHVQGYVIFKTNQRLPAVKKIWPTAHWEVAKGTTEQNVSYCSKGGEYYEYGTKPKTKKEIGEDSKERWADVIKCAKEGTCEENYPAEWVRYNSTLSRMLKKDLQPNDALCGVWYYGPSGSGKSRTARLDYPGSYDKLLNKWWDNYNNEEYVILDDLDPFFAPSMGHALKRYADHYPFRAEVKGSSMVIRPKAIIVTSQYTIEELWPQDQELVSALKRRFTVKVFGTNMFEKTVRSQPLPNYGGYK